MATITYTNMFLPLQRILALVGHYVFNNLAHTDDLPGDGTHGTILCW
jgi:hypothetical protein